jgi:acetoin utilization protein AcuC
MASRAPAQGPLLVFGPRSLTYDFGPWHPLTPRRFGPGIDLLRAVGAEPGLAPEPASDEELGLAHTAAYLATVRAFSDDPDRAPERGIGPGDTPAFAGMHTASAAVAGGSLRAIEAILRGDVEHAIHPGGGLHHAMPDRASGFCVYDDVALAIALARRGGHRVLYVDLDVHHGDGVEAIHAADPGVLTVSFHESGRTLFPGTGELRDVGAGRAAGTVVDVPLEASTGEGPWLAAVRALVPWLAAAFGPDLVVSQHGADSHAWDPLGHLLVTTTAMGEAARLVDRVAHRWAGGRWLATGGGGYDVYRAVPRAWALTWLAGAHRDAPEAVPPAWRERWADEAARFALAPLPMTFVDEPNAGEPVTSLQSTAERRSMQVVEAARGLHIPALLLAAAERGWWDPLDPPVSSSVVGSGGPGDDLTAAPATAAATAPTVLPAVDRATWDRLRISPRVAPPADPVALHALLAAALGDTEVGSLVSAAVDGDLVVGLAISVIGGHDVATSETTRAPETRRILALGVGPTHRANGLGRSLLAAHVGALPPETRIVDAVVGIADRDPIEPLDLSDRLAIGRALLAGAGFQGVRGGAAAPEPGRVELPLRARLVRS